MEDIAQSKQISIFSDKATSSDVFKGRLEDQELLCSVSALAERHERILSMFDQKEFNQQGVYKITLRKTGRPFKVLIDDFLPCEPEAGLIFSYSKENEFWVSLLEKAMAKLYGSYIHLRHVPMRHALFDLTGYPTFTYHFDDAQVKKFFARGKFWDQIRLWDRQGFILVTKTRDELESGAGLVAAQSYNLVDVLNVDGHKLFKLHNPWGE